MSDSIGRIWRKSPRSVQLRGRKSVTGPMLDALISHTADRDQPAELNAVDLRQAEMPELSVPPHNSDHVDAERLLALAPALYQPALRMHFWEGMSEREVAARLRLPIHLTRRWRVLKASGSSGDDWGCSKEVPTAAGSRRESQPRALTSAMYLTAVVVVSTGREARVNSRMARDEASCRLFRPCA